MGLVTHPRSRFNFEGQSTREFNRLAELLGGRGLLIDSVVSDRNDFTLSGEKIGFIDRIKSAWLQVRAEKAWWDYLRTSHGSPETSGNPRTLFFMGMLIKRVLAFSLDQRVLERLANIDLSHLRVLDEGIASGADWVLVIEDDATYEDIQGVAEKIQTAVSYLSDGERNLFVNFSKSIDTGELRVDQIIANSQEALHLEDGTSLLNVLPPISNTVCANMYSRVFAIGFAESITASGIVPSIPIDWRLNKYILSAGPSNIECYWVLPGPFVQGSMHPISRSGS
jgi:hypothetical protein